MKKLVSVYLSAKDIGFLCNAINEARQVGEAEFNARTGETFEQLAVVHDHIANLGPTISDDETKFRFSIEFQDMRLLCKAIIIALDEVKHYWEFHSRTGSTPEEAKTLLNYLQTKLNEAL